MRLWPSVVAIAFALLAAPSAHADVPLAGTFLAKTACPALQSFNRNTNPGNIALTPQQTYQLVSANNTPATHFLVIVPGAEPDHRWVPVNCGTKLSSSDAVTTLPSETSAIQPTVPDNTTVTPPAPQPAASRSGSPTHYVLSLSWEPGFCAGKPGKPECAAETPKSFEASHFTLHGLWPDPREYCGVASSDIAADKAGRWDDLPAVKLGADTRAQLDRGMPGTQSLLERHEWLRHGTCSGSDADAYFSRALGFLDTINASPVRALFAANIGKSLSLDAIRSAFDRSLGHGAGDRVRLSCPRQNGQRQITEITIGLDGDVMGGASLQSLIAGARPTNGGCDVGDVVAAGR